MRNIREVKDLRGKKVLLRVDFNVPMKGGKVEDNFRIKKSLPTIKLLQKRGAKTILITHLGREGQTLSSVAKELSKFISVKFVPEIFGDKVKRSISLMKNGDVILLENLRRDPGEQRGSQAFARELAEQGEMYVNDAFAVSHREDASIFLLPKLLPSYAGLLLEEEVKHLSKVLISPKHPFLFILGGAKFFTKMPLIKKFISSADNVYVGGALAHDFLKARGYEVGASLVSGDNYEILKKLKDKKIILPTDVLVISGSKLINKKIEKIEKEDNIVDIGTESVKVLQDLVKGSNLILWNGPLGRYEDKGEKATKKILKLVASSKAESILGGGDTSALISKMGLEKNLTFVSTGGGATLDFLANGTLPGIKALG